MSLVLTNSLTRRKDLFVPADPARVSMYVCGPTVYNYAHVGNARPAVVFDVLYRLLKRRFANVIYARNFTDVDDKINAAASAVNEPISVLTARYIDAYHADMAALGVLAPDLEPRVTEHIPDIVNMIERLIAREHAYVAEDHVFMSPPIPTTVCWRDAVRMRWSPARVSKSPLSNDIRRISSFGSHQRKTSPDGPAPGVAAGPVGISNARR